MSDSSPSTPPSKWRYRLYVLAGLPFLLSPVSLFSLAVLYVSLLCAVLLYAAYIAMKDFVVDELQQRGWLTQEVVDSPQRDEAIGADNTKLEEDFPILSYPIVGQLFMGPPLVVYVSTRGTVQGWLYSSKWVVRKSVQGIPIVWRASLSLGQRVLNGCKILWDVGVTIWRTVETPVVAVFSSVYRTTADVFLAVWHYTTVVLPTLTEQVLSSMWKVAIYFAEGTKWIGRKIYNLGAFLGRPFGKVMYGIYEFLSIQFLRGMRLALNILTTVEAKLRPLFLTVVETLTVTFRSVIVIVFRATSSLAQSVVTLGQALFVPPLRFLFRTTTAALRITRNVSIKTTDLLVRSARPVLSVSFQLFHYLQGILATSGAYTFVLSLPDRIVNLIDALCYAFEASLSMIVKHTYAQTLYIHQIASPVFLKLLEILQPLLDVGFSALGLVQKAGGIYLVYAVQVTRRVGSAGARISLYIALEVKRAAERARRAGDAIGKQVAKVVSTGIARTSK
ncbi:uncharacterized protein SPPG_05194 [Spizellomyces punctatus DAOM BR117]|uniref:Uncharacterized protein n=1 Tax=Spizellomyces punctatus (strain DAOM BR117) TaxID=645134 RepID=A0A0L0HFV8_SPIPD|nr:uncharacterized protein SPPG_05194 [Spizellomyces punctatus DAOM BR117]KNC99819.1 hypothetical protein SPPG_05194 [Spizellomyces punctatus DAOM BR117]|eukprot:XP_016607859.1 hypothetical protein SPPG_05194 [Spizellomyces punctatus DAOM BR117]